MRALRRSSQAAPELRTCAWSLLFCTGPQVRCCETDRAWLCDAAGIQKLPPYANGFSRRSRACRREKRGSHRSSELRELRDCASFMIARVWAPCRRDRCSSRSMSRDPFSPRCPLGSPIIGQCSCLLSFRTRRCLLPLWMEGWGRGGRRRRHLRSGFCREGLFVDNISSNRARAEGCTQGLIRRPLCTYFRLRSSNSWSC